MTAVPPGAVTAAAVALRGFLQPWLGASVHGTTLESQIHTAAAIAVRDATPHIAAALLADIAVLQDDTPLTPATRPADRPDLPQHGLALPDDPY